MSDAHSPSFSLLLFFSSSLFLSDIHSLSITIICCRARGGAKRKAGEEGTVDEEMQVEEEEDTLMGVDVEAS